MKFWPIALLGLVESGCATHETVTYQEKAMDRCSIVAEQRMQDGALNGYNEGMQKRAYVGALADCKKWESSYRMLIAPIAARGKP
jgi:hypothetical protein